METLLGEQEAAKQLIICSKRLRAKVKIGRAKAPLAPPVPLPLYVEVVNLSFSTLLFSLNPLTNNLFCFSLHDCVH